MLKYSFQVSVLYLGISFFRKFFTFTPYILPVHKYMYFLLCTFEKHARFFCVFKKKYIVLRVPKLFEMLRLLMQDLCSVQSRLFCHNSSFFSKLSMNVRFQNEHFLLFTSVHFRTCTYSTFTCVCVFLFLFFFTVSRTFTQAQNVKTFASSACWWIKLK